MSAKRKPAQVGRAGRYDEIAERLAHDLKAAAVVLLVVDGRHGNGMSISADPRRGGAPLALGDGLAALLRIMADKLDSGEASPNGVRLSGDMEDPS